MKEKTLRKKNISDLHFDFSLAHVPSANIEHRGWKLSPLCFQQTGSDQHDFGEHLCYQYLKPNINSNLTNKSIHCDHSFEIYLF